MPLALFLRCSGSNSRETAEVVAGGSCEGSLNDWAIANGEDDVAA